jgi:hypothetical protein
MLPGRARRSGSAAQRLRLPPRYRGGRIHGPGLRRFGYGTLQPRAKPLSRGHRVRVSGSPSYPRPAAATIGRRPPGERAPCNGRPASGAAPWASGAAPCPPDGNVEGGESGDKLGVSGERGDLRAQGPPASPRHRPTIGANPLVPPHLINRCRAGLRMCGRARRGLVAARPTPAPAPTRSRLDEDGCWGETGRAGHASGTREW